MLENKQKFISQIMSSKSPARSCQDVDETVLSFAEIKALCSGNPAIREKMDLDVEVARLRLLKSEHQSQHYLLEDKLLKYFPESIEKTKGYIASFEADMKLVEKNTPSTSAGFMPMEIHGVVHAEKEAAGKALLEVCKMLNSVQPVNVGKYRGFDMALSFDSFDRKYNLTLKGDISHKVELGPDVFGNIKRIDNELANIPQRLKSAQVQLENLYSQVESAKAEVEKTFSLERELFEKSARLAEVNAELDIDSRPKSDEVETTAAKQTAPMVSNDIAMKAKPSILANLRRKSQDPRQILPNRGTRTIGSSKKDMVKE